jgi:hypothetical protein
MNRGHAFANSMDQFSWLKPWMLLVVLAIAQVAFDAHALATRQQ